MEISWVIQAGTACFRRNWIPILTLTLLAHLPFIPLRIITSQGLETGNATGISFTEIGHYFLISAVGFLISLAWTSVLLVAVYRLVSHDLGGRPPDMTEALSYAFGRFFPIVITKIIMGVLLGTALIAGLFFFGVFLMMWLLMGWALVNPIMAHEETYYFAAMRRSWKLMFGSPTPSGAAPAYRRYIFLYILYILIAFLLGIVSSLPRSVSAFGAIFAEPGLEELSPSRISIVISVLLWFGAKSVLMGLLVCVIFVFYSHLKARFEPPPVTPETVPLPPVES